MALYLISAALIALLVLVGAAYARHLFRPSGPQTRNVGRRMLPVLAASHGLTPKTCAQCHYFEQTGFAEVARRAPAAAEAARWLSPAQMSTVEKKTGGREGWTEEAGFDAQEGQPVAMGGPRWDEIGVCHSQAGLLTFPGSSCERWR